ncbi:MAG: autotransporter-associated beta strand repeat-containing protein [Burkholderiales bacterium]|nr:autotransporter-associated beta strand repeat-containing protein [Burkholderiales bacterium]
MNKIYRLVWNSLAQCWQAVSESARGRGKSAVATLLLAAAALLPAAALAVPAVFFDGVTANGQAKFSDVVSTASPTATLFQYDFSSSASSQFSVTQDGTTVFVRTSRNGAPNSFTGGFDNWSVGYDASGGTAAWNEIVHEGFTVEFFSDASYTTSYLVNAVGLTVNDWGTCCTNGGVTPDGSVEAGSAIYAVFDAGGAASTSLIGNITSTADRGTSDNMHFVAAIDDRNSFSSVTFVPNGSGEYFGAGGTLFFSIVPLNSVPEGSSSVTIGQPPVPNIDTTRSGYTTAELSATQVRPVFDGGTLVLADSGVVAADFEIRATGGTIDTAGQTGHFSGVIADSTGASGALTKAGEGTLTLAGANTYSGRTTVAAGTLELTGSLASSDIRIDSGATLVSADGGLHATSVVVADGTLSLGADEAITGLRGSGAVALGTHTLGVTEGEFSGVISGSGTLHKTGADTLTLSGNNTHTGITRVSGGELVVSADANLGGAGASISLDGGTLAVTGNMLTAKALEVTAQGGTLSTAAATTTVLTGAMSGSGDLVKQGAGELVIAGNSTHTGNIALQQGSLKVHGDLVSGNGITVFGGTTLAGYGRVGGPVQVLAGGRLAPGASPGTLTVAGDVTLNAGSLFDVEIDGYGTGTGAGNYDRLVLTGQHTFTAAGTLSTLMRGIAGPADNTFTARIGDVFNIVDATDGTVTGRFDTLAQPVGGGLPDRSRYEVIYEASRVNLVVLPVSFAEAAGNGGGRSNAAAAGGGVDEIVGRTDINGTGPAAALLRSLTGLDEGGLAARLASLSGEAHANALAASLRDSQGLRNAVFDRQPGEDCGVGRDGTAAAPAGRTDCRRLWASVSRTDDRPGATAWSQGQRSMSTLTSFGFEQASGPASVRGVAVGFAQGSSSNAYTGDAVSTQSIQGSGYLSVATAAGEFTQIVGVGVSRHEVDRGARSAAGVAANESAYNSVQLFGDSRLVTPVAAWGATSVSSIVGLRLDYLKRSARTEGGDAASALELASYGKLHAQAQLGAQLRHAFAGSDTGRNEFTLKALYSHPLSGDGVRTQAALHGAQWEARSSGAGGGRLMLGLGLAHQTKSSSFGVQAWAGQSRGDSSDRGLQVSYSTRW